METATLESARKEYRSWQRFTEEPEIISALIASLCRVPSAAEQAFVESEHGDNLYLLSWLNGAAEQGFAQKESAPFPSGAVVVKEKLRRAASGEYELFALGVLIKHAPGYSPTYGDWEFGYWEAEGGMRSGAETQTYCGDCHASSRTDFVFLDHRWRQPQPL